MSLQMTLDRFRFHKKGKPGQDQGEGSDSRPCTPENLIDVDCIPETPQSQQPSPASPVFIAAKKKPRNHAAVVVSDDESSDNDAADEDDEEDKTTLPVAGRPSSSTSGYCSNGEGGAVARETEDKVSHLQEIFPEQSREELLEVILDTSCLESAVAAAFKLSYKKEKTTKKQCTPLKKTEGNTEGSRKKASVSAKLRKFRFDVPVDLTEEGASSSSQGLSDSTPMKEEKCDSPGTPIKHGSKLRKLRVAVFDESDEEGDKKTDGDSEPSNHKLKSSTLTRPSSPNSVLRCIRIEDRNEKDSPRETQDSDVTEIDSQAREMLVGELQEFFPDMPKEDIVAALEAENWDQEAAASSLSYRMEKDQEVNERPSRRKQKLNPRKEPPAETVAGTSKQKKKPKPSTKKPKYADSDDDDDGDAYGSDDDLDDSFGEDDEDAEDMPSEKQVALLSLFSESTLEELMTVPGCSKKKAEVIMAARPFKNWKNIVDKFSTTAGLSLTILWSGQVLLKERQVIKRLMDQCHKISKAHQRIVTSQMGRSLEHEDDEGDIQLTEQPGNVNQSMQLKPYQLVGLNWLALLHSQGTNGILADEMGLGKTAQAISFLAYLLEQGDDGPHLIIVPSSTLDNWVRELAQWCPDLKVLIYYGSQMDRQAMRDDILEGVEDFHVLVTTYQCCVGSATDRTLFNKKVAFHYAILDEGHMLKNMQTQRYQQLLRIRSERRLLLTGTPIQNNLLELMSLLNFIMPDMFSARTTELRRMFASVSKGKSESKFQRERIEHAKRIMQPFVLRRLKRDVLTQLPKKHEQVEHCPMTDKQVELYADLKAKLSRSLKTEDGSSTFSGAMMQLRKMANHPLLHRTYYTLDTLRDMSKLMLKEPTHHDANADLIFEDMEVMSDFELNNLCKMYASLNEYTLPPDLLLDSGKFRLLDRLLPEMAERGDRVLLFSQLTMMLDIVEPYLKRRKYKYVRLDGQTPVTES
ncbi:SWI/SNF-related matrix-associated actin-dependent regulator of chromatin subfamily A containing DEAD/H box 1-like [Branchiostoma floridae]|uniref:DNA helicase n=1 Tax=Branchiostoma floridae TaxID=7739 RepID=A0A9J7LMC0_BRAFL|nr:SWI/SNF-related matrix-associated actin-dependent regulator of chromatin subfamily A containing DEAD/H box 1-like [Branchiostoma floridae]